MFVIRWCGSFVNDGDLYLERSRRRDQDQTAFTFWPKSIILASLRRGRGPVGNLAPRQSRYRDLGILNVRRRPPV